MNLQSSLKILVTTENQIIILMRLSRFILQLIPYLILTNSDGS